MSKTQKAHIGLFYGSSTCYTEMAAEKICKELETYSESDDSDSKIRVDIFNVNQTSLVEVGFYTRILLGIPTWDYGELQEDWEDIWPEINDIDFNGKTVALFGLGDQIGYPEWFLDAMGYLHDKVESQGATLVGYWPNKGYTFEDSKALTEDQSSFVGLALDDETEFEKTDERIRLWCKQLKTEFKL